MAPLIYDVVVVLVKDMISAARMVSSTSALSLRASDATRPLAMSATPWLVTITVQAAIPATILVYCSLSRNMAADKVFSIASDISFAHLYTGKSIQNNGIIANDLL